MSSGMPEISMIKDCLFRYVQIILQFEKALIEVYHLHDHPYQSQKLFPRTGTVKSGDDLFDYRFHGSGCSLKFQNLEIHFDYYIVLEDYISTNPWKFTEFIKGYWANKESLPSIDKVEVALIELNQSSIIKKTYPDYLVYQISFSWFKTYTPVSYISPPGFHS